MALSLPNKPRMSRDDLIARVYDVVNSEDIRSERSLKEWSKAPVKLFGDRGYFAKKGNKRGVYDDAIFIETIDGDRAAFNANVDPSSSKSGRATLESNQIVWYRPGWHGYGRKSGHKAFRQNSVVVVRRDGGTGNGKPLGNGLFQDRSNSRFWINLHRGGYNTTSSAGCQTIPPQQWTAFYEFTMAMLKRYGANEFPYLLLP